MILGIFGPAQLLVILLIIGLILVNVFYLLNLQDTLKEIGESRRQVPPGNVWLMFIPVFNLIYPFILYPKVCDSLREEYAYRGIEKSGDFGRGLGITLPILSLISIIPYLGILASLGHFIVLIVFWTQMAGYKNELRRSPKSGASSVGMSSSDLLDS